MTAILAKYRKVQPSITEPAALATSPHLVRDLAL